MLETTPEILQCIRLHLLVASGEDESLVLKMTIKELEDFIRNKYEHRINKVEADIAALTRLIGELKIQENRSRVPETDSAKY